MVYSKSYIELQYKFAKTLVDRFNLNILETIFDYTNIYLLLTLDFSFNKENDIWKDIVENYQDNPEYIYSKYLAAHNNSKRIDIKKGEPFGCFTYHYEEDGKIIKLHFSNNDTSGFGPLSKERINIRKEELFEMFKEVKMKYPEAQYVKGKSWLYNFEGYKRLFPQSFIKSLKEYVGEEWKFMTLWGQFLDSKGDVKANLANDFLDCAKSKESVKEIQKCFPFKIYLAQTKISDFY